MSKTFRSGKKRLKPVIWSHDRRGDSSASTGFCMHLASHGFIVFAITHFDGSASYSENKYGTQVLYNSSKRNDSQEFKLLDQQIDFRVMELSSLLVDIIDVDESDKLRANILGVDSHKARIAERELTVGGVNYGGTSALEFAAQLGDSNCKCLILYNPWLYPHYD